MIQIESDESGTCPGCHACGEWPADDDMNLVAPYLDMLETQYAEYKKTYDKALLASATFWLQEAVNAGAGAEQVAKALDGTRSK